MWFNSLAYGSLIHRTPAGVSEPGIASSWAYSNGGKTFTVQLKSSVEFSDGTPVTAADVVSSVQYYQKNGTFANDLGNLASVTASGPSTVVFQLSKPDPLLPYYLDQEDGAAPIIAPSALANPTSLSSATDGAGPYMLDAAATVANSSYVYVPNPHYYDPSQQYWSKIVIEIITSDSSTLAALQSGQVQAAEGYSTTASAAKAAGLKITAEQGDLAGVYLFDTNGSLVPALKNLKVREALNYAINRKGIAKALYGSYGVPTDQYEPNGAPGYQKSLANVYSFNPTKAKALLKSAKVKNLRFTLAVQPGAPGGTEIAQAMVQEWSAIGVKVSIKTYTGFAGYVAALEQKKIAATTFGYSYSVFVSMMDELWAPTGTYNLFGVNYPSENSLRAAINVAGTTSATGVKDTNEAMKDAVDGAYGIPVVSTDTMIFSTSAVSGINFSSTFPIPDPAEWTPGS
jgi:peptide/nickel transport system substrate-binding protein